MPSLMDKYHTPNLNFRLGLEFDVAISKERHKKFQESTGSKEQDKESGADATPIDETTQIGLIIDNEVVIKNWIKFLAAWEKQKPLAPNPGSDGNSEVIEDYDKPDSLDTQASRSFDSMRSIVHYLRDHFNHELPHSPKTIPLIAPVLLAEDAKSFSSDQWYLSIDYSVETTREEFFLVLESEAPPSGIKIPEQPTMPNILVTKEESPEIVQFLKDHKKYRQAMDAIRQAKTDRLRNIKKMWRVGGVELVSAVFQFNDRASWLPKLEEVQQRLTTSNERAFFPLRTSNMLHVHVGIDGDQNFGLDSPLGLSCMKNVIALYGLFEDEIGRWLPVARRNGNYWAKRVRLGQETFDPKTESTSRYTPQAFTEAIYAQQNIPDLRAATNLGDAEGRNITVHISPQGKNKPTTIEFRQHHGTIEASSIRWWSTFVCQLVKFSYFVAQVGVEIRDHDDIRNRALGSQKNGFVGELNKKTSVLDLVGLSQQGKQYFNSMAAKCQDDRQDAMRELDLFIIRERAKLVRRTGLLPTDHSDEGIRRSPEYIREKERVMSKYKVEELDRAGEETLNW